MMEQCEIEATVKPHRIESFFEQFAGYYPRIILVKLAQTKP
jgi:hypothetical protein